VESITSQLGIVRRTMPSAVKLLCLVDGTPAHAIPGMETLPRSALITATCRAVELKFGAPIPRISLAGDGRLRRFMFWERGSEGGRRDVGSRWIDQWSRACHRIEKNMGH
jgi:hypothetical protein